VYNVSKLGLLRSGDPFFMGKFRKNGKTALGLFDACLLTFRLGLREA
jgi:hypothetical protein